MKISKTTLLAGAVSACSLCSISSAKDYASSHDGWSYWLDGSGYSSGNYESFWFSGSDRLGLPTAEDTFTYSGDWFQTHIIGKDLMALGQADGTLYAKSMHITARHEILINATDANLKPYDLPDWPAPSLNVAGDAIFEWNGYSSGGSASVSFGNAPNYAGFDQIKIGSNLDVSTFANGAGFVWNLDRTTNPANAKKPQYSESVLSLEVGGVFKVGAGQINLNGMGGGNVKLGTYNMHAFVQLGGLDGDGAMISNVDIDGRETTIIFKSASGFQGGDFKGGFSQYWEAPGKTHIIMDSGSGNVQSISITKKGSDVTNQSSLAELTALVRSGSLALGNSGSADKFTKVGLVGGKLGFTDLEQIRTQSFVWDSTKGGGYDGGIMSFSLYDTNGASDVLIIEDGGKAEFVGDSFLFELAMTDDAMFEDGFTGNYSLISGDIDGLNSGNAKFKFVDKNGNDVSVNFTGTYDQSTGLFTVSYAIPEPAAIAAVFGALALAIAMRRRR